MARIRSTVLRNVAWRLEAVAFDLFTGVLRLLPLDVASGLGARLAGWIGPMTKADRTAELGLALAFPDMDPAARARLRAAQWENFGRYIFEFSQLDRLTPASGRVEVVGGERLEAIARSGRPVVFISGHLSNLEVMAAVIVASGIPCDVTYRAANNPFVDARIKKSRARYGVRLFAPKGAEGARELLTGMAAGRSAAMMNDQKYDAGVEGVFFGQPVRTNPAAVRLALRFGGELQPMSIQRTRGARFRCVLHPPIPVADTGDRVADIAAGVAAVNAFIEARVRERPEEWWWMHKRWPSEVYARAAEKLTAAGR